MVKTFLLCLSLGVLGEAGPHADGVDQPEAPAATPAPAAVVEPVEPADSIDPIDPMFTEAVASAIIELNRDQLDATLRLTEEAAAMEPRRWEPMAIQASVSARRGSYGEAVILMRQAIEHAAGAQRQRLEALVTGWDRQRMTTLMLAEAAQALESDQPYLAVDRLALVVAVMAGAEARPAPAEPTLAAEAWDDEALFAALDRPHGSDVMLQANRLLSMIAASARRRPVVADELAGNASSDATVRRVTSDLWASAQRLHQLGRDGEALATVDQLLRLSPGHAAAQALAEALWRPEGALAADLDWLITRARANELVEADSIRLEALGGDRVTVSQDERGSVSAAASLTLGRFSGNAQAISAFTGFVDRCAKALPPGWVREESGARLCRLRPPVHGVVLELQLVSVAYDQPEPVVQADVVVIARHVGDGAVASGR